MLIWLLGFAATLLIAAAVAIVVTLVVLVMYGAYTVTLVAAASEIDAQLRS